MLLLLKAFKRLILSILFLLLFGSILFAQKNDIQVKRENIVFGKNLLDGSEIRGTQFNFTENIYHTYLDTARGFVTVQLRGKSKNGKVLDNKGRVVYYDLNKNEIKWQKSISYYAGGIWQNSNIIIQMVTGKNYMLDLENGNLSSQIHSSIYYLAENESIGFGYSLKNIEGFDNPILGIDFNTTKVLWGRDIPDNFGWDGVYQQNDYQVIIATSGLYQLDIRTGQGWSYSMLTGEVDGMGKGRNRVSKDILDGKKDFYVNPSNLYAVYNVASNLEWDSLSVYYASKNLLIRLDDQYGEVIWKTALPENFTSKSSIFIDENSLFLINKGYAYKGYFPIHYGKPFIARFNRTTGKQVYLSLINLNNNPIINFKLFHNKAYLLFKDRISSYSLDDGNMLHEIRINKESEGYMDFFIGNGIYIESESGQIINLYQSDTTKVYVYTEDDKVLAFKKDLTLDSTIEPTDLFIFHIYHRGLSFMVKKAKTWVQNEEGVKVAEFNASSKSFLIGETLYERNGDSFNEIDLSQLFEQYGESEN